MPRSSRWCCIACGVCLTACVEMPEPKGEQARITDAAVDAEAAQDGGGLLRPPTGEPYNGPECESAPVQGAPKPAAAAAQAGAGAQAGRAAVPPERDPGEDEPPPAAAGSGGFAAPPQLDAAVPDAPRPGPGEIVISEIMSNPEAIRDDAGEWFELHNPSETQAFSLAGCAIDDGGERPRPLAGPLVIDALGYAVIARSEEVAFAAAATLSFSLANAEDRLALLCDGVVIDAVAYGQGYPLLPGASLSLDPMALDAAQNDEAGAWCAAAGEGAGDRGSPGLENARCEIAADAGPP